MNANYFHELAAKYDAWFATPHGSYVHRFEREAVMALAAPAPGMTVADIGCGTGIYTDELLQAGARVTGVDISPEMLALAARRTARHGDAVAFLTGDAAALPFATASFDMVTSITAMEFFADPRACLQDMYRIVKPGGRLVVATLGSLSPWAWQRRLKTYFKKTVFRHATFHSLGDLRAYLAPHKITAWRGAIFVPPFAPAALIRRPDPFERWCQNHIPSMGAFLVVRVDKPE
ncbi:MAG: methyltransferase domain-containing protein [Sporomusaceae bacterium]|nr:methyltransferase domain-containing protein [Sporomusaceae bacterium]